MGSEGRDELCIQTFVQQNFLDRDVHLGHASLVIANESLAGFKLLISLFEPHF